MNPSIHNSGSASAGASPRRLFLPIMSKVEKGIYRLLTEEKEDQDAEGSVGLLSDAEEYDSSSSDVFWCPNHSCNSRKTPLSSSATTTSDNFAMLASSSLKTKYSNKQRHKTMRPSFSEFNSFDSAILKQQSTSSNQHQHTANGTAHLNHKDKQQQETQKQQPVAPTMALSMESQEEVDENDDDDDAVSEMTMCPVTPCDDNGGLIVGDKATLLAGNQKLATDVDREMLLEIFENPDSFVKRPVPTGSTFRCRLIRNRKGIDHGLFPTYYLHLERKQAKKVFLLAARKRKRSATTNFLISTDPTDLSRNGRSCIGKLRSNALGTQFALYDSGLSPKRDRAELGGKLLRQELCALIYEPNLLGMKGPRRITLLLPSLAERQDVPKVEFRPSCRRQTMIERWKSCRPDDIFEMHNKEPAWNEDIQAYVLNFHGRVTQASVKNFQIIHKLQGQTHLVLQFGRIGEDSFTLDFSHPISPLQAFGIALSSFDSKLACE